MKSYKSKTVAEYIAHAPAVAQPKLRELRAAFQAAVPTAEESISWGIPFYKLQGPLGGFAAFKHHVGFGFWAPLDNKDLNALSEKGYGTGKKTIQVRFDQKVPAGFIKKMLKAQAKINAAKKAKK